MTWLEDLATHLETEGYGTLMTSIFIARLPDDEDTPDEAMALYPYDGRVLETFQETEAQPFVQVRLRGDRDRPAEAWARTGDVWRALAIPRGRIDGIECVRPFGTPIPLGIDASNRSVYTINCEVTLA